VAFGAQSWLTPTVLGARLRAGRFPHALVAIEACNSGVFRRSASARVAVLAAARADERSFASRYDARTGEWLGNAFSDALVRVVSAHRAQSLLVAYRRIARAVSTSRPQLYGNAGGLRVDDFFGR
jgi:hypothetical protein